MQGVGTPVTFFCAKVARDTSISTMPVVITPSTSHCRGSTYEAWQHMARA